MLAACSIQTPTLSYFEHNETRRTPELIERLAQGQRIALVTDAGTPAISDPGFRLVKAANEAGVNVIASPGPCAAIAALSIAGIPTDRFVFEGFLPAKAGARQRTLERLAREERTIVIYEAARRLANTLGQLAGCFGPERQAAVAREISKTFEETVRGTVAELAERFHREPALGEVTIVIEGAPPGTARGAGGDASEAASDSITVEALREAGLSLKDASAVVARLRGRSRREVYQDALHRAERDR